IAEGRFREQRGHELAGSLRRPDGARAPEPASRLRRHASGAFRGPDDPPGEVHVMIRRFSAAAFAAALLTPGLAACNSTGTGEAGASASPTVSGSIAPSGASPGTGDA